MKNRIVQICPVLVLVAATLGCAHRNLQQTHAPVTLTGDVLSRSMPHHNPDPPSMSPLAAGNWLRIRKMDRQLLVYVGRRIVESYPISLGYSPVSAKDHRDDLKTPEGLYYLCQRNPHSHFYRSLRISYPNVRDAERCAGEGIITDQELTAIRRAIKHHRVPPQDTRAGGDILIHGGGTGRDWTWGCIALDNANMKKLYDTVALGTPVLIEK